MSEFEEIKKKLLQKKQPKPTIQDKNYLSTGSTLLDLACSGKAGCGFAKGGYYFLVGDSSSGKSFLSATCLAEATINPAFKTYSLRYRDYEGGALLLKPKFFGDTLFKRLDHWKVKDLSKPPTLDDFYDELEDDLSKGPRIEIVDSMDYLFPKAVLDRQKEAKKARKSNKEAPGSYGTDKAKVNSARLPHILAALEKTGSILIVISQTRDNIGFGAQFNPKTRGGGHALTFYATLELWSSVKGQIKKPYKGSQIQQGIISRVRCKKNRQTGRDRTADVHIYHSHGIDDIGSCVEYLIDQDQWKKTDGKLKTDFGTYKGIEDLIAYIEKNNKEAELHEVVQQAWDARESVAEITRKKKYL